MDPLASDAPLVVYIDYKSPYAFLAAEPTYALEDEFGIEIDWRPLTLDIPSFLGSAKTDGHGKVLENKRSPRQWVGVKYAYRDCRRYASLRDLTLRGTTKIWDSSLAAIGLLWAKREDRAVLRTYTSLVYERFWRRELDIEDPDVIQGVLRESGSDVSGFPDFLNGEGRVAHDELQASVHPAGLFGVPTYIIQNEVFFGREHLPTIRWYLSGQPGPRPDVAYQHFPAS